MFNDNKKNNKGDEDMAKIIETTISNQEIRKDGRARISQDAVDELVKAKSVIRFEDGVAQIDKSHPDYNFWMED